MGKIFKPRIKINEMAPQWSSGSVLSKDFLESTKKQLLKLYYSGGIRDGVELLTAYLKAIVM